MVVNFTGLKAKTTVSFPGQALVSWYDDVKRELPWRKTSDPYRIWLSEIILQQTRVAQGVPYYERFVKTYPTVRDLANASEDAVLKLWEGLGYYSRARNLHAAAKHVSQQLKGEFPNTHAGLLELKGVGPYTAAAIGSIAFNLPVAAVDGNVYRVLARYFGIADSIDETSTKKQIADLAQEVLDDSNSGDHNQAMMELGATVCTPKQPDCDSCPLQKSCVGFSQGAQSEIPVRTKKTKVRNRYFYYCIRSVKGKVEIQRRGGGDIWQGLYEFPFFEPENKLKDEEILEWVGVSEEDVVVSVSQEFKHILSHQRIYARFVMVRSASKRKGNYTWVSVNDLRNFAFPRLINRYLERSTFVIDGEVSNI